MDGHGEAHAGAAAGSAQARWAGGCCREGEVGGRGGVGKKRSCLPTGGERPHRRPAGGSPEPAVLENLGYSSLLPCPKGRYEDVQSAESTLH
jgi:hypothetical protein